jgi:hypothetical protein
VRFRDEKPGDVERTREVVRGWRAANPQDTPEQLLADVGHQFHSDWAPVLRSVLITVDRHRAREVTGQASPGRGHP